MSSGPHASEKVIVNTVNPGLCHSNLTREATGIIGVIFGLMKLLLARSTETGGRIFVFAAAAGEKSHGSYISDCVIVEPGGLVKGKEGEKLQKRVFVELMAVLEDIQPGITANI